MLPLDNDPTTKNFLVTWTILGVGFLAGLIIRKCAVMFLFEGPFGSVLHITDCLSALTPHLARRIDYLFLARCSLRFPATQDSIRQVIDCIWKHPSALVVYLVCDMLGQEDVLVGVSKAFGSKIYVDREKNSDCHQRLAHVTPEILAADDAAPSTRFHVLSFPRLSEQATEILAQARAARQLKPLIIRPSSQWYAYYDPPPPEEASTQQQQQKPVLTEAMCDELGVWHVCLSMHSSREELEQALGILKPKWVVYTMSSCMVVDLSYVRKQCSLSQVRT
jgi:DNA cross-link repair 1A protein|uniref:DNA repair metallo-beta-lactamase domain-containing protein n=1 Tax=Zea mays TaxID=4577 RepID=A0A804Q3S1_MAIZE